MIITRTPFRISFFGGGTDISEWFMEEGGQVLSTTVDKYCYVTARPLPPFFDHTIRVAYSRMEMVAKPNEIQHPLIRTILKEYKKNNIEIHYDSDLPGNSGLGTSSSFGVGLLGALHGLKGEMLSPKELAEKVIHIERNVLNEPGGYQDQIAASYGGFNHILFRTDGSWDVYPVLISKERQKELSNMLFLCYIPIKRFSGNVSLANNFRKKDYETKLRFIYNSVNHAKEILKNGNLSDFGELLDEVWRHKRVFSNVTNFTVDEVYEKAKKSGATGGKILGAGGGGFMIFYVPLDRQEEFKKKMRTMLFVPFGFEQNGMQVIYFRR